MNDKIMRYVMEAQRINADFWVVRTFKPSGKDTTTSLKCDGANGKVETKTLVGGETLVLKVVCIPARNQLHSIKSYRLHDLSYRTQHPKTPRSSTNPPRSTSTAT